MCSIMEGGSARFLVDTLSFLCYISVVFFWNVSFLIGTGASWVRHDPSKGCKAERTAGSNADVGYELTRSFCCISLMKGVCPVHLLAAWQPCAFRHTSTCGWSIRVVKVKSLPSRLSPARKPVFYGRSWISHAIRGDVRSTSPFLLLFCFCFCFFTFIFAFYFDFVAALFLLIFLLLSF